MTLSGVPQTSMQLRAGTVLGRRHLLAQRNNQDALAFAHAEGGFWVGTLADGCSEGRASEVGANLGTRFALRWMLERWSGLRDESGAAIAGRLEHDLLEYLALVFEPLASEEGRPLLLRDLALFTFFLLVADPERTLVLGLGDGLVADQLGVNRLLPSRPDEPDYLAYHLLRRDLGAGHLRPVYEAETRSISYLLVATDGLFALSDGEVEALGREQSRRGNPLALERQLRVFAHRQRRLHDDTTALLLSKKEASPCAST